MDDVKTNTTLIMEQYNFNAPINVNIIYDDDEETNEGIITENENVQSERKQRVNVPSTTVGSNLGVEVQAPTFNQINGNLDSDTLKVVIDNMSGIVGAHFKFEQVCKTLSAAELQRFKVKFMEMKYLFFKRSMIVAKYLLLPQKNNEIFIDNIVAEILKKAKVNSNMYSSVRLLYSDLIAWTEYQIESERREFVVTNNLEPYATQSKNTATHLSSGNSKNRKRRFPSNEIQDTNASKEILKNNRCQIAMQTELNSYPLSSNNAPRNYSTNLPPCYHPQKNNYNQINGLQPVINLEEEPNLLKIRLVGAYPTSSQNTMQTNTSMSQSSVDNFSYLEKTGAGGQDVCRSSISRDSGFMSPDILFSPQESMNTNYQDPSLWQTPTTQDTPISNNGRVGTCQVCRRQTDLLCLGCFQIFYCSNMCQKTHWPSHKLKCRNSISFVSNYKNGR